MNSTITTFTDRPPKAWKAPEFSQPMLVRTHDLRPLGEVRGFRWWTHSKHDGDLSERPERLTDRDILPNRMLVQVDEKGERSYRIFDIHAPGTFASSASKFGPPEPPPWKFRDALPAIYEPRPRVKVPNRLGGGFGDAMVDGRDHAPIVRAPKVRLFGADAIEADIARQGVEYTLGTDGYALVVWDRGDALAHDPGLAQYVRDAAPLIRARKRGEVLACVVGTHAKDEDASAVSVGILGAPACLRHMRERPS